MKSANKLRPLIFGEVLFDRFPDGSSVLGGAPFNVAWHLQAFAALPLFISRVGDDFLGHQVIASMHEWGMDTSGLQLDPKHPTGTVDVSFEQGEPHYAIVENRAYDFIDVDLLPPLHETGSLYHGSLVLRSVVTGLALQGIKEQRQIPVFVDLNLRAPWWDLVVIEQIMADAHWLKLNAEELAQIVTYEFDMITRAHAFFSRSALQYLCITRGSAGAIILSAERTRLQVQPNKEIPVVDTVGAGDAFCSVLLLGQHRNWPLPKTLERAQQFASAIVGIKGATIKNREFYQPFIDAWEE
jgi:fructokinase